MRSTQQKMVYTTKFVALLWLFCGQAFAQVTPGVATRVDHGASLPTHAEQYSEFILTTGTPTLYICNNNPCMISGDWVASGGGGGGGGANVALSNLSGVAINAALVPAQGSALSLHGADDDLSHAPSAVTIRGGNGTSSGNPGAAVNITGGAGGTVAANGANVNLTAGAAGTGGAPNVGNIVLSIPNTANGQTGFITLQTGNSVTGVRGAINLLASGSGPGVGYGYVNISAGTLTLRGTRGGGTIPTIQLYAGAGGPGEMDIDLGNSAGQINIYNGLFFYPTDNVQDFDSSTNRPRNAYFGGNVYANTFVAASGSAPLTQSTGAFNAQGPYSGTPTSQSGQMTTSFGAGGVLLYSFNGGAVNTVANLASNISGNSGTTTAFSGTPTQCAGNQVATGIAANGNANCSTSNVINLQETGTQTSASGFLTIWGSTSTHGPMYSENGGGPLPLGAYPNITNTLLSVANANTVEISAGANPQALYVYQTTDNTNYSRIGLYYDGSSDMTVASEAGGTGTLHNLGFRTGSSTKWEITTTGNPGNEFRPFIDNVFDIGDATHRIRNLYLGTAVAGTSALLCTDNAGTKTITTIGCPSGGAGTVNSGTGGQLAFYSGTGTAVSGLSASNVSGVQGNGAKVQLSTGTTTTNDLVIYDLNGNAIDSTFLYTNIAKIQTCTNQLLSATDNAATAGNCVTVTSSYVDASIATTATLVNTFYPSASGAHGLQNSTVAAGPYSCEWLTYPTLGSGTPTSGATLNRASVWGVNLPEPCTTTKITYDVITGDTSGGTYDLGLYTYAGVLAAHIGNTAASTSFTATGIHTVNWTGTVLLQAGKYYLAITCSATTLCATFGGASSNGATFISNTLVTVSSGGTLSTPITPPADSMSYGSAIPVMVIQ